MIKETVVDEYWSSHTVRSEYLKSRDEVELYAKWRLNKYPLYFEMMCLEEKHKDEIIVDYGCGPGNDIINFLKTDAKKIIGIDISDKAINIAKHSVSLYPDNKIPIEFIKITDGNSIMPIEDKSVDYVLCSGVLHHVSNPVKILREFYRILKDGTRARIMVYNRDSIFYHVYVGYKLGGGRDNNIDEVFRRSTDGEMCPKSKAYLPEEFIMLCNNAGFKTKFIGGYLSTIDNVTYLNKYKQKLLKDIRIKKEHKNFVKEIKVDDLGYPTYRGKYCGIGGVYELRK